MMFKAVFMSVQLAGVALAAASSTLSPTVSNSSATYTYDPDGRVRSVLYDNNLCIAYDYDANGNRTSQANTMSAGPETATWGTGYFGCFQWTP